MRSLSFAMFIIVVDGLFARHAVAEIPVILTAIEQSLGVNEHTVSAWKVVETSVAEGIRASPECVCSLEFQGPHSIHMQYQYVLAGGKHQIKPQLPAVVASNLEKSVTARYTESTAMIGSLSEHNEGDVSLPPWIGVWFWPFRVQYYVKEKYEWSEVGESDGRLLIIGKSDFENVVLEIGSDRRSILSLSVFGPRGGFENTYTYESKGGSTDRSFRFPSGGMHRRFYTKQLATSKNGAGVTGNYREIAFEQLENYESVSGRLVIGLQLLPQGTLVHDRIQKTSYYNEGRTMSTNRVKELASQAAREIRVPGGSTWMYVAILAMAVALLFIGIFIFRRSSTSNI